MAKCEDLEFIPVKNEMNDGRFQYKTKADILNGTLQEHGNKEFVKVEVINEAIYLVVKKE